MRKPVARDVTRNVKEMKIKSFIIATIIPIADVPRRAGPSCREDPSFGDGSSGGRPRRRSHSSHPVSAAFTAREKEIDYEDYDDDRDEHNDRLGRRRRCFILFLPLLLHIINHSARYCWCGGGGHRSRRHSTYINHHIPETSRAVRVRYLHGVSSGRYLSALRSRMRLSRVFGAASRVSTLSSRHRRQTGRRRGEENRGSVNNIHILENVYTAYTLRCRQAWPRRGKDSHVNFFLHKLVNQDLSRATLLFAFQWVGRSVSALFTQLFHEVSAPARVQATASWS